MLETVKKHPYLIGGVGVSVFVLVLLLSRGSTEDVVGTVDSVQSANDYNNAQATAAYQMAGISAASQAASEQTAASVEITKIQAGVASDANILAAQVAEFTTGKSADVAVTHDTLSAHVAESNNQLQSTLAQINATAITSNTKIVADALTKQAQLTADAANHASDNATAVATQSWFDKIF